MHAHPPQIQLVDDDAIALHDELMRRLTNSASWIRRGPPDNGAPGVLVGRRLTVDVTSLRSAAGVILLAPDMAEEDRVRRAVAGLESLWLDVLPDPAAEMLAERALELLLALARHGDGLPGTTVGLVGFGAANRALARLLRPFDADVGYWSPTGELRVVESHRRSALQTGAVERPFSTLIRTSEMLVVDLPDTPGNQPAIGRAELALMRDGASLINLTSSTALDDGALIQALRGDYLAGLALGRTNLEPLPDDSPLLAFDRVRYEPELATVDLAAARRRMAGRLARTLARRPELHLSLRRVRHVARRRPRASEQNGTEPKGRD